MFFEMSLQQAGTLLCGSDVLAMHCGMHCSNGFNSAILSFCAMGKDECDSSSAGAACHLFITAEQACIKHTGHSCTLAANPLPTTTHFEFHLH